MGRSSKKKLDDFLRGLEIRRLKEQAEQQQIALDYLKTHNMLAYDNETYPVTEQVLTSQPNELKKLLGPEEKMQVNPDDFPDGLVVDWDFWKLTFY